MDLGLEKFINSELTWSAVKKGRRSMTRHPRKTEAKGSEYGFRSGIKTHGSTVFDYEKSGVAILGRHFAEEVLDVPIKKRILLLQSTGQGAQSPQPRTPSPHREPPMGGGHASEAIELTEKAVPHLNDFSGIELLAAAACHSSVHDSSSHVDSSAAEKHLTPGAESYPEGMKQDVSSMGSDDSAVQDNQIPVTENLCDNGNEESDKSPVPSKVARLHWDLNTVMEEWEEPCGILDDPHFEKGYLEDVHNDGGYLVKNNVAESCLTKADVVGSFRNPAKCEVVSTSTASISLEGTTIKAEFDDKRAVSVIVQGGSVSLEHETDDKLTSEDHLSDCCGSNVSEDKDKSGYDSPVEDGELREQARHTWEKEELEELDCVDYESDDTYEDNSDAIESVTNETVVDHPQTITPSPSLPHNDMEQDDKADVLYSKQSQSVILAEKGSSSNDILPTRKNTLCRDRSTPKPSIRHSRSERDFGREKFMGREGPSYHGGQWVDSFSRNSHRSGGYPRPKAVRSGGSSSIDNNNEAIDYNERRIYRNESYNIHSGIPQSKGISRDRSRVIGLRRDSHEEFNNPDPFYFERKVPFFTSNFNRSANLSRPDKRPRSRSRSGSPIAWHFQKKRNEDTKGPSPDFRTPHETEAFLVSRTGRMPPQGASRSFDGRNVINGQYRDKRSSPVRAFHRAHQRHEPSGYVEKSKSNDHFRPRLSSTGNYSRVYDDKYGMMNERRHLRYDDDESYKGYSRYKDNSFRYTRNENKFSRDPENTSHYEKCCRYTANKMFNTREEHFHKDN